MGSGKMTMSSESSTANDENRNINNNPYSVLVVDDDLIVRTIHKTMLSQRGMEVHLAVNGQEAVEFHRAGASFDLILMDLQMPVMDGYQATRKLRDMGIHCSIVGITSCTDAERNMFMESGLDDCIFKPLTLDKIVSYIPFLANNNSEVEDNINSYISYTYENDDIHSSCSSSNNC